MKGVPIKDSLKQRFSTPIFFSFPEWSSILSHKILYSIIIIESFLLVVLMGADVWYYRAHIKNNSKQQKRDLPTFINKAVTLPVNKSPLG